MIFYGASFSNFLEIKEFIPIATLSASILLVVWQQYKNQDREKEMYLLKSSMDNTFKILTIFFGEHKAGLLLYGPEAAINFYISKYEPCSQFIFDYMSNISFKFLDPYVEYIVNNRKKTNNEVSPILLKKLLIIDDGHLHQDIVKEIEEARDFIAEKCLRQQFIPNDNSFLNKMYKKYDPGDHIGFNKEYKEFSNKRNEIQIYINFHRLSKEEALKRFVFDENSLLENSEKEIIEMYKEIIESYFK